MQTETQSTNSAGESGGESTVDAKILADLNQLKEKMDLCDKMMHPGDGSPAPSLKNNDALLGVIGFLEACAPRMKELVEAAAQGALSEQVLEECLVVNDGLLKMLEDIDTFAFTETPAETTAASSTPSHSIHDDLDDLLLDDDDDDKNKGGKQSTGDDAPVGTKTTGEDNEPPADTKASDDPFSDLLAPTTQKPPATAEDPFGSDVLTPSAEPTTSPAPAPTTTSETTAPTDTPKDDFDAFLEDRTSK